MLVLSRKIGQQIIIGDGIVLVVKRIAGQRVTFGIEAPQDVRIVRGELTPFAEPVQRVDAAQGPHRVVSVPAATAPAAPAPLDLPTGADPCLAKPR